MRVILPKLIAAWRHGTVIRFRYGLRSKTLALYAGRIETLNVEQEKVRIVLCDLETAEPLSDDFGHWQRFTFSLQAMTEVTTIPWLYWPMPNDEAFTDAQEDDEAQTFISLFEPLFTKSRYQVIDALIQSSLFDSKAPARRYQNYLSVIDAGKMHPILSEEMRYNMVTKSWYKEALILHTDQPLYRFFKRIPTSLTTIESVQSFFQSHRREGVELNTRKQLLIEEREHVKQAHQRLSTWLLEGANNRPAAHFFKRHYVLQRGRRNVKLPTLPKRFNPRESHAVHEAMKGPLTLIQATTALRVEAVLDLLVATALMSELPVLIIDSTDNLDLTPWPGLLRLSHIDTLQADLNLPPHRSDRDLCTIDVVSQAVFSSVEAGDAWVRKVTALQAYAHHSLQHGLFHENIRIQSALNDVYQETPIVPIKTWLQAPHTFEDWHDALCKKARNRYMKLSRHGYQQIHTVIEQARAGDVKPLFKALQSPTLFHKLKQVFPVMVCRSTACLPYVKEAFDQVVVINPKPDFVTDTYYGERLTLIETKPMQLKYTAPKKTPALLATYYGDWFTYFKQLGATSIKVLPAHHAVQEAPVSIHRMHHAEDHPAHCVLPEAKQLAERVKTRLSLGVIRTPFNQQRQLLQTMLETPVKTLHHPVIGQPLWISWAIHKAMPQKTYDWLKNNPYMTYALTVAESIESWVDVEALECLSDGEDRVYEHVMKGLYPDTTIYRLPTLSFGFKKLFKTAFKATVTVDQPLTQIKHFECFEHLKASYVFRCHKGREIIIVLTDCDAVPLERLMRLQAQGRTQDIQVWVLAAAHKAAFLEHLAWLKSWGWLQEQAVRQS